MAKQKGVFKFSGVLGNEVGYYRNGQFIVQRKGGFDGERIKTEEQYEGIRQRNVEFGKCSKISSMFKRIFDFYLATLPVPMIYNWIQSLVMGVKDCDVLHTKGERTFLAGAKSDAGKVLLHSFEFNKLKSVNDGIVVTDASVLSTGRFSFRVLDGKLFGKNAMNAVLFVVSVDFDTVSCDIVACERVVSDYSAVIDLRVELPEKKDCLMAFLYLGKVSSDGSALLRTEKNAMGLVAFDF